MMYLYAAAGLLSGMGVFLLAVYLMNDGLKRAAAGRAGRMLTAISDSKFKGFAAGVAATTAVNSSTVTTVMTVALVDAGVLTLRGAAAIIIGANVASSFTGIIIAAGSLQITVFLSVLALAGAALLLSKNTRLELIGKALAGAGLLFAGLNMMNSAVAGVSDTPFFASLFVAGGSPLLLIIIGALASAVLQSSAAINALVLVLAVPMGAAGLNVVDAVYIILGTNVGTCVTSLMSSIGGGINAKRAALLHLIFNVLGTLIFYLAFIFVSKAALAHLLATLFGSSIKFQLAWFNLAQNVICAVLMLPMCDVLVRLSSHFVAAEDGQTARAAARTKPLARR